MAIKIGATTIWNSANQALYSLINSGTKPAGLVETVTFAQDGQNFWIVDVQLSAHTLTIKTKNN